MIQINKITIAATFAGATALALILAGALGSKPMAVTPAQALPQTAPATAILANELPTVFGGTLPEPAIAAEQTVEPDPPASLDPADRAIAEKIRDLLATKLDRFFVSKKERAAALAFYQDRNLAPLWLDKGVENRRATLVIARIKNADADGLEPRDYKLPNFRGLEPDALADAELKLTQTVLTFARHLQAGRFPYTRVSRNIELPQLPPETADILGSVADAADAGQALDAFSPQQEPYRKLKAMLAELRDKSSGAKSEVSRQIETVIANMERWRWYPRDLGNAYVLVNQPDFTLTVMRNGAQAWTTRIVIGKPSMPTPLLSETMKYITVNPTWHVPPSIVHNEYLTCASPGSDGARSHGLAGELQRWRGADHPAAGRWECARTDSVQFSQSLFSLSARHAGQAFVWAKIPRL
jgi:murein L,D-transpeptidase YcbB/YkuD